MFEYIAGAIVFLGFWVVVIVLGSERDRRVDANEQNTKIVFERLLSSGYSLERIIGYSRKLAHNELLYMALQRMTCAQLKATLVEACSKKGEDLVSAIFHSIDLSFDVTRLDQCLHALYEKNLLVRDGCACNATLSRTIRTSFTKYLLCCEAEAGQITQACLPDILSSSNPCETFYILLSISKYYGDDTQYELLKEFASSENCTPKYSREDVLFVSSLDAKSMNWATVWLKKFEEVGEDFSI